MTERIYIIHASAIVQQGLSAILQRQFHCPVKSYAAFRELFSSGDPVNRSCLLIVSEALASDVGYKRIMSEHPGIGFFLLFNGIPPEQPEAGAPYIYMDHSPAEICKRIGRAFSGIPEEKQPSELTGREIEVLKLLAMGNSNKEIAAKLFISTHTVISHRKNISEKLSIRSASGLTVYAVLNHHIDTTNLDPGDLI